ncbi:MAG: ABC transporter ATP-binding protein [Syntrophomonadaceae bacterium]|nr:ABC transporter ATP-binding protein [Syntrophomonadaceae bacterium]
MPLLAVENLSFAYSHSDVLSDISFNVNRKEIFFLLGPNGCGKTTLLDCILGLLKLRQGSVKFMGKELNGRRPEDIARQVAYVPQSHEKTFPYTVREIVLMGRAAYIGMFSSPSPEDMRAVEEALEKVGIIRLIDRRYTQLSGGEGQLVLIARALAQKTAMLVMDEPTAHLDFKHELVIMETIVELVRETGLAIIMATHFPNHAFYFENSNIATRVALMNDHRFLMAGRPSEVLSEGNLKTIYNVNTRVVSYSIDANHDLKQVIPISTQSS